MPHRAHSRKTKPNVNHSHKSAGPRASWRGMMRFGLVSFPVEAFNARAPEESPVAMHQLHAECHSRIRHQKVCPVHGPVPNDEIVSGYEYRKGQYVEIDPEELDTLRTTGERSLAIDAFIAPEELDPIYLDGRMYFLSPDGDTAREPYAVFLAALERQNRWGLGQVVFSGKQQLVIVRPYRGALHMAMLNYAAEIRDPRDAVGGVPHVAASDRKVRLAEQLITSWSDEDVDFTDYEDTYAAKVRELIAAKVEGREVVVPEAEAEPAVINLVDALRKSIGKAPADRSKKHRRTAASGNHRPAHTAHGKRRRAS